VRLRSGAFALVLAFGSACVFVTNLDALRAGGVAADGGGDALVDAPATDGGSDGGFCAQHPGHTLCSDFDEPNPFGAWVLEVAPVDAGTLELSDANVSSLPYSMRTLARPPDAGATYERLTYDLKVSPKHAHVELVLRACDVKTGVVPLVELLCISPNAKFGGVWLHVVNGTMTLRLHPPLGTTDYSATPVDVPAVMSTGHKIVLDVVFGANGSVSYARDGVDIVSQTGIDTSCLPNSGLQLSIGSTTFPGGPDCESFYDDVLVDLGP
jgi:hypothetical protein